MRNQFRFRLELNTTHIAETPVYITVSPCSAGVDWAVYKGAAGCTDDKLRLLFEYNGEEAKTFSAVVSELDRYLLQLSSKKGGAAAISVRGEAIQQVRLRVRAKSKRKLTTNWEPRWAVINSSACTSSDPARFTATSIGVASVFAMLSRNLDLGNTELLAYKKYPPCELKPGSSL
ncbi:hypothetical protein EVAR_97862_1 [Eumeta japonica]|uniref:Uncharacterized protein n=1 Tax=Eumeta variegata TaxID=151549 RepID=A0A4C1WZZ8_EUMVA|nr:hypothetical protein EVAR_97862_1 [Eumeta japonica]